MVAVTRSSQASSQSVREHFAATHTRGLNHCTAQQIARFMPGEEGDLLGDKSTCGIFDNTKIKRLVPDFVCTVPFAEGVRRSVAYFEAHPELKTIDEAWNRSIDAIIEADRRFHP